MKHVRRICTILLTATLLITNVTPIRATSESVAETEAIVPANYATEDIEGWPEGPQIGSGAAVLIEAETGTVLYGKNMDEAYYPASITKILTALLAIENCSLSEMVTFSDNAVFSIPRNSSHIAITPNEELSIENCLYGLLLASANEVANALAEHISGTTEAFAELMNERARQAGAKNTHFANANGLPDDNHYTTCYDMAMIGRAAIQNDTFLKINGVTSYMIPPTNLQPESRPVNSQHGLLVNGRNHYDGCFGGKTGYTEAAGNTLVSFAERNGMTLICVVMRSEQQYEYVDSAALFDYGFTYFKKWNVSENDTKYSFNNNFFSPVSPIYNDERLHINLNQNDIIILPTTANFSDVESTILYTSSENEDTPISSADNSTLALIDYTYYGHYVGSTTLGVSFATASNLEDFASKEPASASIVENPLKTTTSPLDSSEGKRVIRLNIWYLIGALAIIALIIVAVIIWKKTSQQRARYRRIRRQKRHTFFLSRRARRRRGLHF